MLGRIGGIDTSRLTASNSFSARFKQSILNGIRSCEPPADGGKQREKSCRASPEMLLRSCKKPGTGMKPGTFPMPPEWPDSCYSKSGVSWFHTSQCPKPKRNGFMHLQNRLSELPISPQNGGAHPHEDPIHAPPPLTRASGRGRGRGLPNHRNGSTDSGQRPDRRRSREESLRPPFPLPKAWQPSDTLPSVQP